VHAHNIFFPTSETDCVCLLLQYSSTYYKVIPCGINPLCIPSSVPMVLGPETRGRQASDSDGRPSHTVSRAKGATCRLLLGVVQLLFSMGHASLSHEGASGARGLGGR